MKFVTVSNISKRSEQQKVANLMAVSDAILFLLIDGLPAVYINTAQEITLCGDIKLRQERKLRKKRK